MTDTHDAQAGIAGALGQLSEETRALVRQEIDSARDELWERAKALGPAVGLLALAGGLGVASAASAYRLALRIVERATSPGVAALVATAGFGTGSAAALAAGLGRLREAPLPVPAATAADAAEAARRVGHAVQDAAAEPAGDQG